MEGSGPKPHRLTSGPMVGSKAPCDNLFILNASAITLPKEGVTDIQSPLLCALILEISESAL